MLRFNHSHHRAWFAASAVGAWALLAGCTLLTPAPASAQIDAETAYLGDHFAARVAIALRDYERAIELLEPHRTKEDAPPQILLALSDAYLGARRRPDAIDAASQAVERHPRFAPARELRARLFVQSDRLPEAVADLEVASEEMPRNAEILEQIGVLRLQTIRDWADSENPDSTAGRLIDVYRRLAELRSGAPKVQPLVILSAIFTQLSRTDEAIAAAREAIAARPQDARGHRALADALMGADRAEEALQALREALLAEPDNADVHRQIRRLIAQERIEGGALGFYRELAKERPSYKSIQELFGEELMRAREWGEAREHFESFADRWPEDRGARLAALFAGAMERGEEGMAELLGGVFGDPPASADEVVELAGLFLGANASASAEALLERANEQWPADPRLAVMLASAQISEGRRDEAIATLEELNEVNPGDPQAVGALTQLYLEKYQPARQQDDHDEAIVWLKKLTALNDRAPAFHLEAGGLFLQSGRLEEAEAAVRQGLERFPEESGFYLLGGNVFYEKKEIDEAEKILRRGIEKFPGDASLYNNLGYFLTEAGRNLEEALKLVEKANELEPGQDFILDSVGWTHFKLGNAAKAVEFLEKAILANAANPQGPDPVLFDHLGDAYAKAGDRDKALAQWRRALEIDPESEKVDAAAIQKKIDGR